MATPQLRFLVVLALSLGLLFDHRASAAGTDNLIQSTCAQTQYPDLCVSLLEADPRSSSHDLKDHVKIFLDLSLSNATATYCYIDQLLDNTTDGGLRLSLNLCSVVYDIGSNRLRDAALFLDTKSYQDVDRLVGEAKDQAIRCEDAFKTPPEIRPSPLTQRNELFENLCSISQGIVFVVGHGWGEMIGWYFCLIRPDRVKVLVNLSLAFRPRNPWRKTVDILRAAFGDNYYVCRFQELGEIEAEFARVGTTKVLKTYLTALDPAPLYIPKGKEIGGSLSTPITLPSWLTEEDVNYYATKFDHTGFSGGLNYYRALNLTWELTAPWTGLQVKVPVKFIVGDQDLTYSYSPIN